MNSTSLPQSAVAAAVQRLFRTESAPGVLLFVAALLAMLVANSPMAGAHQAFLDIPIVVKIGAFEIAKPLLLWVNDGFMAVFFFLVGLELKREVLQGELSTVRQAFLPVAAAIGGIAGPAAIYAVLNAGDPVAARGWAIPAATDIAFALGVLALLGDRVPRGLKIFLLSVAIVDDVGAILIIALFYSSAPPPITLAIAGAALGVLIMLNRSGVTRISPYLLVGLVLWAAVLKSGVHATLAGVLLALTIPLRTRGKEGEAPALQLERDLHPPVVFGILPLFAFANAGVSFDNMQFADLAHSVPLGITAGLFLGKQIGVMLVVIPLVAMGLARLPSGANWASFYGVALITGIGFTMSLFIGSLAFKEEFAAQLPVDERVGILLGSALSAVAGYLVLRYSLHRRTRT
ncbi:MAG: Na+/H+ antiporter NhaA [Burkholderiales bacterium]|nr:Na+/H+ antiporter NhaA [Burkholderiales bacterium]